LSFSWSFRLGDLVKYSVDLPIYTLAVCICMSKRTFAGFPPDLQAAITDQSGVGEAERVGASYDRAGKSAFELLNKQKHVIVTPTKAQEDAWRASAEPVVEAQLKALEAQGIKAREAYRLLRETAQKYETK
jgi:TRAP-type C4-dicarboxylate transport system substrate-binding protein